MPQVANPHARTRVSSYQARIERSLTDIFFDVPPHEQETRTVEGTRWTLVSTGHTMGYAQCELCGHVPIRRLFWIAPVARSTDDRMADTVDESRMLMIGSECAQNYARVDLVQAYMNRLVRTQSQNRRSANEQVRRERREENRRQLEEERRRWASEHQAIVAWLQHPIHLVDRRMWGRAQRADSFLTSCAEQVRNQSWLSVSQTASLERNMQDWSAWFNTTLDGSGRRELRAWVRENYNRPSIHHLSIDEVTDDDIEDAEVVDETGTDANIVSLLDQGLLAPETDEPATASDAPGILNGTYTLGGSGTTYHYQIHTVQRSRTAPDLVGKRIIKARNSDGEFKGFAYLTKSGHVRVWRRMMPQANEPVYQYANTLMAILREMPMHIPAESIYGRLFNERRWQVVRQSTCRYCNAQVNMGDFIDVCRDHMSQSSTSSAQRARERGWIGTHPPSGTQALREQVASHGTRRPPRRELLLDELGQGEVR